VHYNKWLIYSIPPLVRMFTSNGIYSVVLVRILLCPQQILLTLTEMELGIKWNIRYLVALMTTTLEVLTIFGCKLLNHF